MNDIRKLDLSIRVQGPTAPGGSSRADSSWVLDLDAPLDRRLALFTGGLLAAILLLALPGCADDQGLFVEPKPATSTTGSLQGFVFDRDTNPVSPVVGAKVYTLPTPFPGARTNSAGFYRLDNVAVGTQDVVSISPEGVSLFGRTSVRAGQVSNLDLVYGFGPDGDLSEIGFLTRFFTPGNSSFATINPRGGDFRLRPLSQLGGNLRSLQWSRANTDEVLVVSDFESPSGEVYLSNIRNSTTRRLTSNGVAEDSADLSPDGERFVYAIDSDSNGRFEIVASRLDGSNAVVLVPDMDTGTTRLRDSRDPVWSPDGTSIVFSSRRLDAGASAFETSFNLILLPVVTVIDPGDSRFNSVVASGAPVLLTLNIADDRRSAWDPLGGNIYFDRAVASRNQLFTVAVSPGSQALQITNDLFFNTSPSISFEGTRIAWVSTSTLAGSNPDAEAEVFIGQFSRTGDRVTGITSISQLTRTPAGSAISLARFRSPPPGASSLIDGIVR